MAQSATYVDGSTFTVASDYTHIFVYGRRVKANCDTDGNKYSHVTSSSYDSNNDETTVNLADSVLTSSLVEVWFGGIAAGAEHAMPIHDHSGRDQGGPVTPLDRLERIARGDYQSHAALNGYSGELHDIFVDQSKVSSLTDVIVNSGYDGNALLSQYSGYSILWTYGAVNGTLGESSSDPSGFALDISNSYLFVGDHAQGVHKFDTSGDPIETFTSYVPPYDSTETYDCIDINDSSEIVVSIGTDVSVIDVQGNELRKFSGHSNTVTAVAIDSNGNLLTGDSNGVVIKSDSSGNVIWTNDADFSGYVNGLDIDDVGDCYVTDAGSNKVARLKSNDGSIDLSFSTYDPPRNIKVVNSTKDMIITCDWDGDGRIIKYDSSGNLIWGKDPADSPNYKIINLSPDSSQIIAGKEGAFDVYSVDDGTEILSHASDLSGRVIGVIDSDFGYYAVDEAEGSTSNWGFTLLKVGKTEKYYSSGNFTSVLFSLGFTPSKLRVEQSVDVPADEDLQFVVSDNSGNSVTVTQSDIGTQVDCSTFADGDITVQSNFSTSDGNDTPTLYEYALYFK